MDDEKVREIFFRHLQDKNVNEAVAEAHREMGDGILADIYESQMVDKAVWELLLKIIRSMARVNLFSPYFKEAPETDTVLFGPEFFADISFFFQTWRDAVAHVIANFDRLMSEEVKAKYDIEAFRVMLYGIDKQLYEQSENMVGNGHVTLARAEFDLMNLGLTWALRSVMGKDNYDKFRAEFNKHLPSLKMYYELAASPPGSGTKPS